MWLKFKMVSILEYIKIEPTETILHSLNISLKVSRSVIKNAQKDILYQCRILSLKEIWMIL